MKKAVVEPVSPVDYRATRQPAKPVAMTSILIYAAAFVLSILVSLAPLRRLVGVEQLTWPTYKLLVTPGVWLPTDLHLSNNINASRISTHIILFLLCIALAFVFYLMGAWLLRRQAAQGNYRNTLRVIWLVTIFLGLVLVFMPAMLSHDIFVYTAYGRILTVYHANPYVTTLINFPHDPFFRLDDWKDAPAAYGPIWIAICGLGSLLIGDSPDRALLVYRLLALGAHLLNTLLVTHILRQMGHSPRSVALGTLLYAWNPLALEESSLGAHNDIFMVTLILLGIFFSVRSEGRESVSRPHPRNYLPALLAFTLATLIKFTAAPALILYLILLSCKAFGTEAIGGFVSLRSALLSRLRAVLLTTLPAGLVSAGLAFLLYLPFWIGLSIDSVITSFTSPPSAYAADNSIMFAITQWIKAHGLPSNSSWTFPLFSIFAQHQTWNYINIATMACMLLLSLIWIWRNPTTRTMVMATLATLGAALIVTFWFFPWYVIWLVGLMAISLPNSQKQSTSTFSSASSPLLIAFALTFSISAFCIYLFYNQYSSIGTWIGWTCLTTIGPPLVVMLIALSLQRYIRKGNVTSKRNLC